MLNLVRKIMESNPGTLSVMASQPTRLDEYDEDVADGQASLEDRAEQEELYAALWQAVDELPYRDKEILMMFVVEGQTQEVIARRFGISRPAITERIPRILAHLRSQLSGAYKG